MMLNLGPQWVLASIRSIAGRASWETVWAVVEGYYGFGVVLGDRLNPAETNFAVHQGWLPWWIISLIFAGLYLPDPVPDLACTCYLVDCSQYGNG